MRSQDELIYFDNAATSFPKPPSVVDAVAAHLREAAINPGRTGTDLARAAGARIDELRRRLSEHFHNPADDPDRCVFTANATDALNLALRGVLRPGDRVVTTAVEHNSVLRPLHMLEAEGLVRVDIAPCDGHGAVDPDAVRALLTRPVRLVVLNHGSNVCGTVQPVAEIARVCRDAGALLMLDAAQTAGVVPVDMAAWGVDLVAFTGHKSLLGPTGTGGLVVGPDVDIRSTRWGGTGVRSAEARHPGEWPYRLEAGTLNAAGLAGLAAGLDWLDEQGPRGTIVHEAPLADRFLAGCRDLAKVRVIGFGGARPDALGPDRLPVVALTVDGLDPATVGEFLDVDHGVSVRTGMHCAPRIHEALGTAPTGAVRFSFGPFNTAAQIDHALAALAVISS